MHDSNLDVDDMISFVIVCESIDKDLSAFATKLGQVQSVCENELIAFEKNLTDFHYLPQSVKEEITLQKQFTDYIRGLTYSLNLNFFYSHLFQLACLEVYYHGKRYSKLAS